MNLDTTLVAEARKVLGTEGTTEAVHRALHEVVARERRRGACEIVEFELLWSARDEQTCSSRPRRSSAAFPSCITTRLSM